MGDKSHNDFQLLLKCKLMECINLVEKKVWIHREEGEICSMFNVLILLDLQMNAVGITENVKGDHRKFEIWYSGREEVYVVQVCS